jgi:hypothetical protein
MRNFKIFLFIIALFSVVNVMHSATVTCKYIIGDGTRENPLTWNGKFGDECGCFLGTAYDCTKECSETGDLDISDIGFGRLGLIGTLPYIDIVASTGVGKISRRSSTSSTTIPSGFFEVTSSNSPEYPIGTRIYVGDFFTDLNGNFSVEGTL